MVLKPTYSAVPRPQREPRDSEVVGIVALSVPDPRSKTVCKQEMKLSTATDVHTSRAIAPHSLRLPLLRVGPWNRDVATSPIAMVLLVPSVILAKRRFV